MSITEFKAGKRKRRASGICRSDTAGKRRPNGYLGNKVGRCSVYSQVLRINGPPLRRE
jgi:hypothetical protein